MTIFPGIRWLLLLHLCVGTARSSLANDQKPVVTGDASKTSVTVECDSASKLFGHLGIVGSFWSAVDKCCWGFIHAASWKGV